MLQGEFFHKLLELQSYPLEYGTNQIYNIRYISVARWSEVWTRVHAEAQKRN